jgi:hypothetical protein
VATVVVTLPSKRRRQTVQETWYSRELPVLTAAVEAFEAEERTPRVRVNYLAGATGLEAAEVARALEALDPDYLEFKKPLGGDPILGRVTAILPAGRRAVGQWPSSGDLLRRLAEALDQVADDTDDSETKNRLRQGGKALGSLTQKVAVEVITRLVEHQTGLA